MRGPLDVNCDLLAADVPHEIVHLNRRIATADELPDVLGVPPTSCVVVRVFDTDRGRMAVAAPAGALLSPPALTRATGARTLHAASPAVTSQVTEFTATLVPPVCLPPDVPVVLDAALADSPILYAATGDGSTALKIRSGDLFEFAAARVAQISAPADELASGSPVVATVPHADVALSAHR